MRKSFAQGTHGDTAFRKESGRPHGSSKAMKQKVKKGSAQAKSFAERKQDENLFRAVKIVAITQQEMLDAASLALNEAFGFGEERLKKFNQAFEAKYQEIRELEKCDNDYAEAKVETALQNAWGKYYVPKEERYDFKIRIGNKDVKL